MKNKRYNVVTPVVNPDSGRTLWPRVGKAFTTEQGQAELVINLTTLPIGAQCPVKLFLYPDNTSDQYNEQVPQSHDRQEAFIEDDIPF